MFEEFVVGVLQEDQVGIHPMIGRSRIAHAVF